MPCDSQYCRNDVNEEEIRLFAQGHLISPTKSAKQAFADILTLASQGDGTLLSPGVAYEQKKGQYAGLTIGCQDWSTSASSSSFEDFQAKIRLGEVFAPLNKGASQSWTMQASCVGWPAPRNPPQKLKIQTQAPILLVNALRDPSTSYTWVVGMLEEIETENSVLLTRNREGHCSWKFNGATTVAINHFLMTAELPAPGTVLDS